MNPDLLRSTWEQAKDHGDQLVVDFYSHLFLIEPAAQALFHPHMAAQRLHLVKALADVVASVDNLEGAVPMLQELGRRHVGYGARPEHYDAVGRALLWTFAHYLGDDWTDEAEQTWTEAYSIVAQVMKDAAAAVVEPVDTEGGRHG